MKTKGGWMETFIAIFVGVVFGLFVWGLTGSYIAGNLVAFVTSFTMSRYLDKVS